MTLCTDLTLVKHHSLGLSAEPLKCKRWSCEWCRPINQKKVISEALSGWPTSFLTLTVNPKIGCDPDRRARMAVKSWRILRKWIMEELEIDRLPFFCVIEAQKSGEPHLHILMRCPYIGQAWLSRKWKQLMGAPIVDIRPVKSKKRAAAYLAKYIGKDPHRFEGTKRYWRSMDWLIPTDEEENTGEGPPVWFEVVKQTYEQWLRDNWPRSNQIVLYDNSCWIAEAVP